MNILGLDPGLATTGYAIVARDHSTFRALDWGIIISPKTLSLPQRLEHITNDLSSLLKRWRPKIAVVESVYFAKNAKSAIAVSHARGVLLLTLSKHRVEVIEITPLQLKSRIASYGNASKDQVQFMVKRLLGLKTAPRPDDAADALALALCGGIKA